MAEYLKVHRRLGGALLTGSDETSDVICQPCSEDNEIVEAVRFCVDCSEFLCDECLSYHPKQTITRHHKLIDIEEAKKDTNISDCPDICTETCHQHSGEVIKYFCVDHDCLGCGVCIILNHRNCQRVQYIPEIANETGNGEDFSNLMRQLDMVLLQTNILAETSQRNKLKSQDSFDKALDRVKQVRKDINEALDRLENEIETEAEKIKTIDMKKMDENIKTCKTLHSQADNLTSNLKRMKQKRQHCNLFVAMKSSHSEIKSLIQPLAEVSKAISVSDYLFHPSKQLETFLKHSGNLAQVCRIDGIKTNAEKLRRKVSVKLPKESMCDLEGLSMIASGKLVFVDANNKAVKLVDINQSKIISKYQLPCVPSDVTVTEESSEIALTLSDRSSILFLRVRGDKLKKQKEIKTTSGCYGVASIKDKLVVSLSSPERLAILDKEGNVIQTIANDAQGEQLFSDVYSLTVDQDTGTIYIPDNDKVTRLALSGQVLGIYQDSGLTYAKCVAIDKRGTAYVCDYTSNTIHQITPDCKKARILLTEEDGLYSPSSLCYDGNTDCLYVGQPGDKVLIFQLSNPTPCLNESD